MNFWPDFIKLKTAIGGNREQVQFEHTFGMPFEEHRKSLQINTFNGYAVYEIKEKQAPKPDGDTVQPQQLSLDNPTGEGVES